MADATEVGTDPDPTNHDTREDAEQASWDRSDDALHNGLDFSIAPDAEYYVPRPGDAFEQLKDFIAEGRGGVFGLTGVRGAGKSVLMRRIEKEFKNRHHTLQIPAPVSSSEETAFFTMLFRELCRSVIAYVDRRILERRGELDVLTRQEVQRWFVRILVFLPLIAIAGYCVWYFLLYGFEYKDQHRKFDAAFGNEVALLMEAHETGVKGIASKVLSTAADVALQTQLNEQASSTRNVEDLKNEIVLIEVEISEASEQVLAVDELLSFLHYLWGASGRVHEYFSPVEGALGKMPHPLHVLFHDEGGESEGGFSLEKFVGSKRFASVRSELGKNLLPGASAIDDLRRYTRSKRLSGDTVNSVREWQAKIGFTGNESFERAANILQDYLRESEADLEEARRVLSQKETVRESIKKELRKAQMVADGLADEDVDSLFSEVAEIEKLSEPVRNAIGALYSYPSSLSFDLFHSEIWRQHLMPTERHMPRATKSDTDFGRQKNDIKEAKLFFIDGLLNRELIKDMGASVSDDYKRTLGDNLDRLESRLKRLHETLVPESGQGVPFLEMRQWGVSPIVIGSVVLSGLLVIGLLVWLSYRVFEALRYGRALALRRRSAQIIRSLDYEVTQSREGGVEGSGLKQLGFKFGFKEEHKGRVLTLPGLTARYLQYVRNVQKVLSASAGSPKLIICIDELDKITDSAQVANVLREIKGALYERDCFYLLSISEDAVQDFDGRLVERRDIFESTFDEIFVLEKLDLATCSEIARKRCGGLRCGPGEASNSEMEEAVEVAAVMSTGVPREFLRNMKTLNVATGKISDLESGWAWHSLYKRKLKEVLKSVSTSEGLEALRADLIHELSTYLTKFRAGFDLRIVEDSLKEVRNRAAAMSSEAEELEKMFESEDRESRAKLIQSDLDLLQRWIKFWTELEICLMTRQCGLVLAEKSRETRSRAYGTLMRIYSGLSYSLEATRRQLETLNGDWSNSLSHERLKEPA